MPQQPNDPRTTPTTTTPTTAIPPNTVRRTMNALLWFQRSGLAVPGPLDQTQLRARIQSHYEETAAFSLISMMDDRDKAEAQAVWLGWDKPTLQALLAAFAEAPQYFSAEQMPVIAQLMTDDDGLEQLVISHENAKETAQLTRVVRLAMMWKMARAEVDRLEQLAQHSLASGSPDPLLMTVYERIRAVQQSAQDKQDRQQDKVRRSFDKGHDAAEAALAQKDEENRILRAQLEKLTTELQALRQAQPVPPPPDGSRRKTGR